MKHIYERDILPFLRILTKDLQVIEKSGKEAYIHCIVKYMAIAGEISNPKALLEVLEENLSEKTTGGIMTLAQALRQEGRQEGKQEGWLLGIAEGEARGEARSKAQIALVS